jgi:hypothetical protein
VRRPILTIGGASPAFARRYHVDFVIEKRVKNCWRVMNSGSAGAAAVLSVLIIVVRSLGSVLLPVGGRRRSSEGLPLCVQYAESAVDLCARTSVMVKGRAGPPIVCWGDEPTGVGEDRSGPHYVTVR